MVVDLERAAVLRVLVLERVEAVRARRDDLLHVVPLQLADVLLRQHLEEELVADAPGRVAAALLVAIALPRQRVIPSATRAGAPAEMPLAVVSPSLDAKIPSSQIRFIWRSAGSDASYTFTLQKSDGSVVWTSSTTDTMTVLPDNIVLAADETWFWSVDALLPDGQSRATKATKFRTGP